VETRALIKLTIATLISLAVLIGLGVWQLQRLEWKEGVIARIEARTERKPVPLSRALELSNEFGDLSYLPVRAEGRFHHAREQYYYAISLDGDPGWHVITPLETVNGHVVLVDRGFVPDRLRDPETRPEGQVEEVVTVTGLIRTPEEPGVFIPKNDPKTNQWFSRDLAAMAGGVVLHRSRRHRGLRRLAEGRADPTRAPQQPPSICGHLVRAGPLSRGGLCRLRVEGVSRKGVLKRCMVMLRGRSPTARVSRKAPFSW
jgi:surfeit locus 1 family protein